MSLARFLLPFFKKEPPMMLFVGLGNPGDKYLKNRHNVGFMAIDAIASSYNFPPFKSKFQGHYSEGMIAGKKVGLLKPTTFMNESGRSVGAAAKFYKLDVSQITVFHDELDIDPFKVKIKVGGGHAGHNGLRSMDAHLGNKNYRRIRLGIGHPGDKSRVSGYVLNDFAKAEQTKLEDMIWGIEKYAELLVSDKQDDFMTRMAEAVR